MTVVSLFHDPAEESSARSTRRTSRLQLTFLWVLPLSLFWTSLGLLSLTFLAALWIILAGQATSIRVLMCKLWRTTRVGAVSALGALIGLVSPRLGTSLVFLYLALHLQQAGQAPFLSCFRSAFKEFFE